MRPLQRFLARLLNSAMRRREEERLREEIEQHLALAAPAHAQEQAPASRILTRSEPIASQP
jgi:hypothetical protein